MSLINGARAVLAHILEGDDHAAPPVVQVERDLFHALAGLATAQTVWGGALYAFLGWRKQGDDAGLRSARRDARIDRNMIVVSVSAGLLAPAAIASTLGLWPAALWAAGWTVLLLGVAAWSLRSRGLA